jgi:hypothetical protein
MNLGIIFIYPRSEIYEFFSFQVNTNGNVLHSEIVGCIKMKTRLSGMPELRLGLNDRVQFESSGRACKLMTNLIFLNLNLIFFFQLDKLLKLQESLLKWKM